MSINNYKYTAELGTTFQTILECKGYLDYGAVVGRDIIHSFLGIKMPKVASHDVFQKIDLYELNMIDHVRRNLLKRGKYFGRDGEAYRVLLPSENKNKIDKFMQSAERKLRRARTLLKNTPVLESVDMEVILQQNRIAVKLDDIKESRAHNELMS